MGSKQPDCVLPYFLNRGFASVNRIKSEIAWSYTVGTLKETFCLFLTRIATMWVLYANEQ